MEEKASSLILSGLRNARVDGVQSVGSLLYIDSCKKWGFEVKLELGIKNKELAFDFPQYSNWYTVLDPSYPLGKIGIYPSKVDGIVETFPHQDINTDGLKELPWRNGKLCLDVPNHSLGLIAGNKDPIGDSEERLRWNLRRAVAWIRAAATNTLVQLGDPFEIPFYPITNFKRFVHDESAIVYPAWKGVKPGEWGIVILDDLADIENTSLAVAFFSRNGNLIRATSKYDKKKHSLYNPKCKKGIWWLWPGPTVLKPWQAPVNWKEIRTIGSTMNINIDEYLPGMAKFLRGKDDPILLAGYPIPKIFGESPSEIFWQAILLPKLKGDGKPPNGFRNNELGWWQRDRTTVFTGSKILDYIDTENWHPDRMQARGRLSLPFRNAKIALIGCGALGSAISELLIRGGVGNLLLIDHDILSAGNLVRHTLSGKEIGENKATAMANKLMSISPFSEIISNTAKFPTVKKEIESLLEDYDTVIDCTADDEVLIALALGWWNMEKLFISTSVGIEAKRTFLFSHRGYSFPHCIFREAINPLLLVEKALWIERGETIEGAGCWSPLFPARLDDILLAASSCTKTIEEMIEKKEIGTKLITFEQISDQGFLGLKRIDTDVKSTEPIE